VPEQYDPLLANLTVWSKTREQCLNKLRRSLEDFTLIGTATNLPLLQKIVSDPEFIAGAYSTDLQVNISKTEQMPYPNAHLRDLAAAAALLYLRRHKIFNPQKSPLLEGGWHSSSRRLPQ
jgi:acetyl/propionyl-CoA carboxylase alpha subunit